MEILLISSIRLKVWENRSLLRKPRNSIFMKYTHQKEIDDGANCILQRVLNISKDVIRTHCSILLLTSSLSLQSGLESNFELSTSHGIRGKPGLLVLCAGLG